MSGRAQIARASCGQAFARRTGRGTSAASVENPHRRFWISAWLRDRMSADPETLEPVHRLQPLFEVAVVPLEGVMVLCVGV